MNVKKFTLLSNSVSSSLLKILGKCQVNPTQLEVSLTERLFSLKKLLKEHFRGSLLSTCEELIVCTSHVLKPKGGKKGKKKEKERIALGSENLEADTSRIQHDVDAGVQAGCFHL